MKLNPAQKIWQRPGKRQLCQPYLPDKSLHLKSEKRIGGKHNKVRLTGMAAANAEGEKLPMFVIGKSVKPRCSTGVINLHCRYRAQMEGMGSRTGQEIWAPRKKDCSDSWQLSRPLQFKSNPASFLRHGVEFQRRLYATASEKLAFLAKPNKVLWMTMTILSRFC